MQNTHSGRQIHEFCRQRNFSHYILRCIIYGIIFLIALPMLIFLAVDPGQWKEWTSWLCILLCTFFGYKLFVAISALINPENGVLGKSLRVYSDGTVETDIPHMFRKVDEDLTDGCMTFGRLLVGKEWILGEEAMRVNRVRGIFRSNMLKKNAREYGIILVDDNDNILTATITRKSDWEAAYNYLTGLFPQADSGEMKDYMTFIAHSCEEREENNKRFERQSAEWQSRRNAEDTGFVFQIGKGEPTSNATLAQILDAIDTLEEKQEIWLTPCIPLQGKAGYNIRLSCRNTGKEALYRIGVFFVEGEEEVRLFVANFTKEDAKTILTDYVKKKAVPDVSQWEERIHTQETKKNENYILFVDSMRYDHILFDDVAEAFEWLKAGKCFRMLLRTPSWQTGYMCVESKTDKYKVEVVGYDSKHQIWGYRIHTVYGGHVINWLSNYYTNDEFPHITPEWQDISPEVRKWLNRK